MFREVALRPAGLADIGHGEEQNRIAFAALKFLLQIGHPVLFSSTQMNFAGEYSNTWR